MTRIIPKSLSSRKFRHVIYVMNFLPSYLQPVAPVYVQPERRQERRTGRP